MAVKSTPAKKTRKKNIPQGIAHIHSNHNNTIVTFSDKKGNVISSHSAGSQGHKGTRKSTPYAASQASNAASEAAKIHGMSEVSVEINGPGPGRDMARKQIEVAGITITSIKDVTPQPHNGTRKPKRILKRLTLRK